MRVLSLTHGETGPEGAPASGRIKDWHPGWMGVVLGTGGTAVVALTDPLPGTRVDYFLGAGLTATASVLALLLAVPYGLRLRRHRGAARADLTHPGIGALYGTVPAAALIVGLAIAQLAIIGWLPHSTVWVVVALLVVGGFGAIAIGLAFFSAVVERDQIAPEVISGAWFIPSVVLVLVPSVAARLGLLTTSWHSAGVAVFATAAWGAGMVLFFLMAPVIVWRLITSNAPPAQQAGTLWIWLAPAGAGGLGLLAVTRLAATLSSDPAARAIPLLGQIGATALWGFGLWWTLFAARLIATARRSVGGLPFHLGSWSFAFPTAALTALTVELGRSWNVDVLKWLGAAGFIVSLLVWVWLAIETVRAVLTGTIYSR